MAILTKAHSPTCRDLLDLYEYETMVIVLAATMFRFLKEYAGN
jgi:hypothetical protein